MSALPIKIYGDPVLREKGREISTEEIDAEFRSYMDDMIETMYEAAGIGLAANQVGETRRFFVADWEQASGEKPRKGKRLKDPKRRNPKAFLNPEILETSAEDELGNEGCLSIPEIESDVYRFKRVRVRYRDLDWQEHDEWLQGLGARVFQHELDHLDGILFIDHLPEDERIKLAGKLRQLKERAKEEQTEPSSAR